MTELGKHQIQFDKAGVRTDVDDATNKLPTSTDLNAGTNIIGKVGIDQTAPGTTDSVTVSTAQGAGDTIGAQSGSAVVTDVAGTIQGYLRGLVKLWIAGLAAGSQIIGKVGIDQTTPGTTDSVSVAIAQGAGATIGSTTDAAVVTDANGTLSAKLRGIIKLLVDKITVKAEINSPLSAFGDLRIVELHPQFQGSFEYTVDNTDLNDNTVVNGGGVTQASAMAVITSSTTTASSALYTSKRHARYKSGLGGLVRFTKLYETGGIAATEQYDGLADEVGSSAAFKNGYMIGFDGVDFGFHRFQNDAKISVTLSAWDDPLDGNGASGMTIDTTKLNVFFIQYQYLGSGPIKIFVESNIDGMPFLAHTITYTNQNTEPSTHNPNFHYQMFVDNKATIENLISKSSSYSYFIEGKTSFIELHQPQNSSGLISLGSITGEVPIFTIKNKALYASKTNFIDVILEQMTGSIEASSANNLGELRFVKNATLGGTPESYSDINTSNSVVEIDTSATTVTGGVEILPIPFAGKNDKHIQNIFDYNVILGPGETMTATGASANSATMKAGVLWKELF